MKLEKLYTLSQFVNLVQYSDGKEDYPASLIFDYNDFLKQPLKKEMFVNELEKPTDVTATIAHTEINYTFHNIDLEAWEAAEKKVIFKDNQFEGMSNYEFVNPKTKKPFRQIAMEDFKTIGELGDYYEGGLELKNVEL